MRRRSNNLIKKAAAIISAAALLVLTSCGGDGKMAAAARFSRLYDEVSAASSLDYEKRITVVISTEKGVYDMSQTERVKAFADGRASYEYESRTVNREVEYCVFCDGENSYIPLYGDVYVKKPAEKLDFASVAPVAESGFISAKKTFEDDREVYMAISDGADVIGYVRAALRDSFDPESMGTKAEYAPVTLFINDSSEERFFALEGEVDLGTLSAEYRIEVEIFSLNGLDEIKYPLDEEELAEVGSYTDFIKSLYPIARVVPRSLFTVLFGFDPGDDFDFFSFDFNDYRGVLYWDAFLEAIK